MSAEDWNSDYEVSCAARLCRSVASTRYSKTKESNNKENKMKKVNLVTIFVTVLGMTEASAKMQAGKYVKKVTGEKQDEDGLVELETVLAIIEEIKASKTSKYKEVANNVLDIIGADEVPDSWYEPKVIKAKESLALKIAKIKEIAEADELTDILEIINA